MTRKTKKRRRSKSANGTNRSNIEFSAIPMPEGTHPEFKAAILKAATRNKAEFPQTLEFVKAHFRSSDPLGLMASFVNYGLMKGVNRDNFAKDSTFSQQHLAELLQAILLTVPFEKWGQSPAPPKAVQKLFDTMPKLSYRFLHQRVLAAQKVMNKRERAILSLMDRIRFDTQMVRNWGYFTEVKQLSTELYSPLDTRFAAQFGFGISDLIQVMGVLVSESERRFSEHSRILQKLKRAKNTQQMAKIYYRCVPDLEGTPEEFMAAMPRNVSRPELWSQLVAHLDLRLSRRATFSADEVAALVGQTVESVETILRAVSLRPGQLIDFNPEHLFLNNPVWTAPGIDLQDHFFITMPQVAFSHIHQLVARLGAEAGLEEELALTRSRFLEAKVRELLSIALPESTIRANAKWQSGEQRFETDCFAIIDRVVVIAEAKSNHLTPEGLRGAPARVKRHVQDLVIKPSNQSKRLEKMIADAKDGDEAAGNIVRELGIDFSKVDRIIRISVTLEDLSFLHSSETKLKQFGWIPDDHDLALNISIIDLTYIIDILDNPICFLHYLSERPFMRKAAKTIGDEIDFLGLYLKTGFNLPASEYINKNIVLSGMSSEIDKYYNFRDAGIKLKKPEVKHRPLFRDILMRLDQRRPDGWTVAGLHLLNSGDYFEQRKLEKSLSELRQMVLKSGRDPEHANSLQVQASKGREVQLVFYLYPEVLHPTYRTTMERLGLEVLDQSKSDECCIIARCIDKWKVPYEAVCVVRRTRTSTVMEVRPVLDTNTNYKP